MHSFTPVVWIVVDTLRADHLGCYGYFRPTSPNIDRIAEEGVLFSAYYASAIATGPAFTSLITGRSALKHGYYITPWNTPNVEQLDSNIPTAAEVMLENGYVTAAFENLLSFRGHPNHFNRGFRYAVNVTPTAHWKPHHTVGSAVNQELLPWLMAHAHDPFFVFVHYWDTHLPYNQPEPYWSRFRHEPGNLDDLRVMRSRAGYEYVPGWGPVGQIFESRDFFRDDEVTWTDRSIDLYDGEVAYVDMLIGQVVDTLRNAGVYDQTLFVVTADHGETLGQHGDYGHGTLYEPVIRVPLIMRLPHTLPAGRVVSEFAQHKDVFPTIQELTGALEGPDFAGDARNDADGHSLLPLIEGQPGPETIFIEAGEGERALREGPWKLIVTTVATSNSFGAQELHVEQQELYNLEDDPMEIRDLSQELPDQTSDLTNKLLNWVASNLGPDGIDPQTKAKVSWTCYVGDDLSPELLT